MRLAKFFSGLWFLSIAILLSCNSSSQGESVFLKFNLEKGKVYSYSMSVDMESEFQGKKTNNDMLFDYDMEVTDDKDGIKTLKGTYKRVMMESNGGNTDIDIDTDKPVADSVPNLRGNPMAAMSTMFHAIVGRSFILKVDEEGRVTGVEGLEEMGEAMLASMNLPEDEKATVRRIYSSQFNEENLKQTFTQSFNIYPNKAVKVGDSWENTIKLPGLATSAIKSTYKVKSITSNKVTLDVNATVTIGKSTGTQTGTLDVDRVTGLITLGQTEQKFEGRMTSRSKITGIVK